MYNYLLCSRAAPFQSLIRVIIEFYQITVFRTFCQLYLLSDFCSNFFVVCVFSSVLKHISNILYCISNFVYLLTLRVLICSHSFLMQCIPVDDLLHNLFKLGFYLDFKEITIQSDLIKR